MVAPLSAPERLSISSTVYNDAGKESSYVIKFQYFTSPPTGSPWQDKDPVFQIHTVMKGDTSYWPESSILEYCKRMAGLLQDPTTISKILRGDK